jgi:demethylmenaquinone methyltransferase/2-methoxy-6-polyprenyl-1,4-benzoquinol methylase
MSGMSAGTVVTGRNAVARAVFAGLPGRYDRLGYLLSFGQDRRWRRAVVRHVTAAEPARVLDVATGPAGIALAIAAAVPATVVGVDLNLPMLRQGASNVRAQHREQQVRLVAARAEALPLAGSSFDAVSFSYLLRYVDDPAATIAEMARCLRPGGTLSGLEFYLPPRRSWRLAWTFYTTLVLPVLGWVGGGRAWWRVGRFLGPSIRDHYARFPLAAHVAAWEKAGLVDVGYRVMSVGGGLVMWGSKGPSP